jgi:hypothetical protein
MFLMGHLRIRGERPAPPPPDTPPREDVFALLRESLVLSQGLLDLQVAKLSLLARQGLTSVLSVALTAVALATVTVTSTWFLLKGMAGALQALCERMPWVGPLVVGLIGLSVGPVLLTIVHKRSENALLRKLDKRARATDAAAAR